MLIHYIKVALRNLLKFKTQTVLSIVGLAIGFACFTLSVTWIRYEMSFDNFHKNGDRIYSVIETQNGTMNKSLMNISQAALFRQSFPEVELSTMVGYCYIDFGENIKKGIVLETTDSSFIRMFPDLFETNPYEQTVDSGCKPMFITKKKALELSDRLKGTFSNIFGMHQIVGTMKELPINSRFYCDAISSVVTSKDEMEKPVQPSNSKPGISSVSIERYSKLEVYTPNYLDIFVLLKKNVDSKAFEKKISSIKYEGQIHHFTLVPLTELRYRCPDPDASLKFTHIVIFAGAGALVILCALFNYITLFVTRIRMRGREMSLRKVNGSTNRQLVALYSTEFLLLLFFSLFVGEIIVELCIPKFVTLSGILYTHSTIYIETLAYALMLIMLSFFIGIIPISYFRRKTLQANICPQTGPSHNLFRKITLTSQLIISIGLIFATIVLFKQINFMTKEGSGLEHENIWNVDVADLNESDFADKIAQISTVVEVNKQNRGFFPEDGCSKISITECNEKGEFTKRCYNVLDADASFFQFYKIPFLIGGPLKEGEKNSVIINESMLKLQENETLESIIGKSIVFGKVAGVVKNFYISSLSEEQKPMVFNASNNKYDKLYYKVMEGKAKEANKAIRTLLEKESGSKEIQFYSLEETLEKVYRSERALLLLLGIITGVCILISIFGIYSMVSLTCQQRRKEIAIRKVFGATVAQILHSFFREYAVLLGIAALIAFPVAYYLMRLWLEQYVRQTSIDGWIYLIILALVALIILVTIWSRVWKAASANPAEVVKSE